MVTPTHLEKLFRCYGQGKEHFTWKTKRQKGTLICVLL